MKKFALSICMLLASVIVSAQSEVNADSIPPITISFDGGYKDFDGFILDMSPVMIAPPPLVSPQLSYRPYNDNGTIRNYNEIFRPNLHVTYDKVLSGLGFIGYGIDMRPNVTMQSATFKLKNGLRITTYGEYDANGYKVRNPSALPWERNNFNAAFEMKSGNGKFGVRIEVQHGR